MIDTKELRLGNYLQYVNDKNILTFRVESISGKTIRVLYNKSVSPLSPGDAQGIPLTGEILHMCGFEHVVNEETNIGFRKLTNPSITIYKDKTTLGNNPVRHPEYLHRLQNLYYALTGKELEVTLPEIRERY